MSKKLTLLLLAFLAFPSAVLAGPDQYQFDKSHTHIIFLVSHVGFSNTVGRIKDYDGYFTFDEKQPEKSVIDVTLKPASIDTSVPALDNELKGDDFFNVKKFPDIHFKSTHIDITGKNTGDVTGDYTMLGITKPIVLHVNYNKSGIHPYTHNYVSGFTADTVIKRSDFGMSSYLAVVGDDVRVHIEVEGNDPLRQSGAVRTPN